MDTRAVSTGNQWERRYGYSRAVRAGSLIVTTGTVALTPDGEPHAPGDAYSQTLRCLEIIEAAIRELGAAKTDVIRCRFYVTDIDRADDFGRAHHEFFGEHHPCLTMVGVAALIAPEFLIEIEVEAVCAP